MCLHELLRKWHLPLFLSIPNKPFLMTAFFACHKKYFHVFSMMTHQFHISQYCYRLMIVCRNSWSKWAIIEFWHMLNIAFLFLSGWFCEPRMSFCLPTGKVIWKNSAARTAWPPSTAKKMKPQINHHKPQEYGHFAACAPDTALYVD